LVSIYITIVLLSLVIIKLTTTIRRTRTSGPSVHPDVLMFYADAIYIYIYIYHLCNTTPILHIVW